MKKRKITTKLLKDSGLKRTYFKKTYLYQIVIGTMETVIGGISFDYRDKILDCWKNMKGERNLCVQNIVIRCEDADTFNDAIRLCGLSDYFKLAENE